MEHLDNLPEIEQALKVSAILAFDFDLAVKNPNLSRRQRIEQAAVHVGVNITTAYEFILLYELEQLIGSWSNAEEVKYIVLRTVAEVKSTEDMDNLLESLGERYNLTAEHMRLLLSMLRDVFSGN